MKVSKNSPCPCGSGQKYKKCCERYHKGLVAKSAVELMKSRYSAFAVGDINYIIKTSTFQKDFDELKRFSQSCEFKKLEILDSFEEDEKAFVVFKVSVFCKEADNSFIEKSFFIKKKSRWFYDSGEILDES